MIIELENIQGFRGRFKYRISELVTIINSKFNGVGKTTLFDCIRFLCDVDSVDKDEREYYLNLEEESGLFSVTVDGITHGFALMKGKDPLFFRKVEGQELERSATNFEGVAQDIGILQINGTLLNIFSKEVNLFSTSKAKDDYQLVKALTTHEPTENVLQIFMNSEETLKQELSELKRDKKLVDSQMATLMYYPHVDMIEHLLDNSFYTDLDDALVRTGNCLSSLFPVKSLDVDSAVLEMVDKFNEAVNSFVVSEELDTNLEPLEKLTELIQLLDTVTTLDSISTLDAKPLEQLITLTEAIDGLQSTPQKLELSLEPLIKLDNLVEAINDLEHISNVHVSLITTSKLSELCVSLGEMITQTGVIQYHEKALSNKREQLSQTRVACPIREEVYLIDGKCCY